MFQIERQRNDREGQSERTKGTMRGDEQKKDRRERKIERRRVKETERETGRRDERMRNYIEVGERE